MHTKIGRERGCHDDDDARVERLKLNRPAYYGSAVIYYYYNNDTRQSSAIPPGRTTHIQSCHIISDCLSLCAYSAQVYIT